MENAKRITATPADPQIIDCRADAILPGSPCAVKNWKPAMMNIMMTMATVIGHTKLKTPEMTFKILMGTLAGGASGMKTYAKVVIGSIEIPATDARMVIFLFIIVN